MSKILLLGDVHGSFDTMMQIYKREAPDAILQCGDFAFKDVKDKNPLNGFYPSKDDLPPCPLIFVFGNHDSEINPPGICLKYFGAHLLKLGDHDPINIVGIGGIPGRSRYCHWGVNGALEKLVQVAHCDILLSHETCSPFYKKLRRGVNKDVGSVDLSFQCQRINANLHVSGHHHVTDLRRSENGTIHLRLGRISDKSYGVLENGKVSIKYI